MEMHATRRPDRWRSQPLPLTRGPSRWIAYSASSGGTGGCDSRMMRAADGGPFGAQR